MGLCLYYCKTRSNAWLRELKEGGSAPEPTPPKIIATG